MSTAREILALQDQIRGLSARLRTIEKAGLPTGGAVIPPDPTAQGDLLTANATPAWALLPIGSGRYMLVVNVGGTDPEWVAPAWSVLTAASGDMTHAHESNGEGGTLDHGLALTGLADDDHTQYLLATGARVGAASQDQRFTNAVRIADGLAIGSVAANPVAEEVWLYHAATGRWIYLERNSTGGLDVRQSAQSAGDELFRVLSSGGTVRFAVEHAGRSYFANYLSVGSGLYIGDATKTANDDDLHMDGSVNLSMPHSARVYRTTDQAIATATWTAIAWTTEQHDTGDDNWVVGAAGRLTAQRAGAYVITGSARFDTAAGGTRRLMRIRLNATTILATSEREPQDVGVNNRSDMNLSTVYYMSTNDYVTLDVYHDRGSNLNIDTASWYPSFTITRLV